MTTTIYIGITTTWSCVVYFYSDLNVVSLFSCATKQTLFSWPPPLPPWLLKERWTQDVVYTLKSRRCCSNVP